MAKKILVTKAVGEKEPFDERKLRRSMRDSGADTHTINRVIKKIESHVKSGVSTSEIHRLAFGLLKSANRTYASRYNLKKAIMEIGPDGFPFERYFAQLLECQGFKTYNNYTLRGSCITHEVDVVAEKHQQGIHAIIEVKFHSRPGRKTGSKDALYTYGRFLDIKKHWSYKKNNGAKPREAKLQSWLVTNTEVTSDVIAYCNCVGINVVAWSYPKNSKSLQDMVHTKALYPITVLTTLNRKQKSDILHKNLVMCKDVIGQERVLRLCGLKPGQIKRCIDEAKELCGLN